MELAGNLGEISLPQLIENLYLKKQTGRLKVKHSQLISTLSFQEGALVDAEFGEDAGPEAVHLAMSLPADARYEFEPGTVGSRQTIDKPWQVVVLDGFCRLKKVNATERSPAVGKPISVAESEKPFSQSPAVLPPPPSRPRQQLSIKSVAIGSVMTAVIVLVISAAVAIASYSGKLGEVKSSEARPSSNPQGSVASAAPAASEAGAPSSPRITESVPAPSVADTSAGGGAAARQAGGHRPDQSAQQTPTAIPPPAGEATPAPAPADNRTPQTATEGWFVILKTFPKQQRVEAAESGERFRNLGHDAQVVDTDTHANFKGGMWAVVLGPYAHGAATEKVRELRPLIPDVYAKQGAAPPRRD